MHLFTDNRSIGEYLLPLLAEGKTVGLVPTMGALHRGHLSLVNRALSENDVVVVSIFVNPTQFNDPNDFRRYPRNPEQDISILQDRMRGEDAVFHPPVEEIYPEPDTRTFDFGGLDRFMEGAYRPGHFNGVAQVVTRLFEILNPTRAYFGEKDFQQLAIIRHITKDLNIPVEIVACPIVREPDGLAMSSRNVLLTPDERKTAASISRALSRARAMRHKATLTEVKQWVTEQLSQLPDMEVEYFEIVDDRTLVPLSRWQKNKGTVGCIAVKLGKVRLIDNIRFS
ncbi:MAG TPA: pantoate--beta-alanine ligase [Bacteroidetes bacterium]|nr:pantoate--beta-alanine ligase [Bacteroidota bacterium]